MNICCKKPDVFFKTLEDWRRWFDFNVDSESLWGFLSPDTSVTQEYVTVYDGSKMIGTCAYSLDSTEGDNGFAFVKLTVNAIVVDKAFRGGVVTPLFVDVLGQLTTDFVDGLRREFAEVYCESDCFPINPGSTKFCDEVNLRMSSISS